ncbi:hypothetical protein BD626DRAFT_400679 [Schizophyllum amplum]|uniref:Uncharacterized protein n=1 Tax=Schizophyllum amplum TaxID=97359 RepID=A0A550CHN2_9AGAR|nr:hypothetical protein BD626DRAFT_400679 [Auriculariopsis ampla]
MSPPAATTHAPGYTPNFFSEHSVVIDRPIDEVFKMIGTESGAEQVTRLSALCTRFDMLKRDEVNLPEGQALQDAAVRTLKASDDTIAAPTGTPASTAPTRRLPRQHFSMTETIPILLGYKHDVLIVGTLTWDAAARVALYESEADQGVLVWKLRRFEEVENGKTRVTERIEGKCSAILRLIVQRETTKGHHAHMDAYHTLF